MLLPLLPLPGIRVWIEAVRDPHTEKNRRGCVSPACPELQVLAAAHGGCMCMVGVVSGVQPSPLGTCSFPWEADCRESGGCL